VSGRRCKALLLGFLWSLAPAFAQETPINIGEPDVMPADCQTEGCPSRSEVCVRITRDGQYECRPRAGATAEVAAAPTPSQSPIRIRAMGGALTALATDAEATVQPLASIGVEAPLSTSARGPSLEVQADLTALPGEAIDFSDVRSFRALEFTVGISQPISAALLFRLYADGGFASRLATSEEPVARLPGWWSIGCLFRTKDRSHSLKVGLGADQRLSGDWAAAVHVSGAAKVGERAGVSMYLVGSLIRALDLRPYYQTPRRDSLRVGVALGR
jgi:hypothetical protein